MVTVEDAAPSSLDAETLYELLRLRTDVFVVEQDCAYPELDGRDLEATTRHIWITGDDGAALAVLRVLAEPDGSHRIGRVATRADRRGEGLARRMLEHVIETTSGPLVLDAQTYLSTWYERLGFVVSGPEFDDEGIMHVPMALRPRRS